MRGGFLCGSIILGKKIAVHSLMCACHMAGGGSFYLLYFQIVNKEYCIEHTRPLRLKCLWKTPQGHHFKLKVLLVEAFDTESVPAPVIR